MRREFKNKTGRLLDTCDLTVAAPIREGLVPSLDAVSYKTRAERVLALMQAGRQGQHEFELTRVLADAAERVGLIHAVRVGIIEPQNLIMLSVTFDGDWEPYMRTVWQKVARLLDLIFCHTEDYTCGWESSYDDWMRWLRRRQVNTPFLYAQPGITFADGELLRSREWLQRDRAGQEDAAWLLKTAHADLVERQLSAGDGADPRFPGSAGYATEHGGDFLIVRQSVRTLAALHRLTDVFLPGTHDGRVLHRAARETLSTLVELIDGNSLPYSEQLGERFADALAWLRKAEPALPPARQAPPLQDTLDGVLPPAQQQDVQAGILSPLRADHGCVLLLRFLDAADLAAFLQRLVPTHHLQPFGSDGISVNLAFSVEGLRVAGLTDDELRQWPDAFYEGMARRAGLLGDVRANHPRCWRLPGRLASGALSAADDGGATGAPAVDLAEVHALLSLRLDRSAGASQAQARGLLIARMKALTADHQRLSLQWLERLPDTGGGTKEHFGWRDGRTDPVFDKARASSKARDHAHVGEALCGHPNAVDDAATVAAHPAAGWLHNGSFLVVRKLHQDVPALEAAVASAPDLEPDLVRAKLMGRWHDGAQAGTPGAPLVAVPPPALRPNHFSFAADPDGALCPLHAHIRRSNPRQPVGSLSNEPRDAAPHAPVRPPRLMRRGMTYGPEYKPGEPSGQDRGLFFMAYNASLAEQFEVMQRWLAGANSAGGDSAQADPLLGVAVPGRARTCIVHHEGRAHRVVLEPAAPLNEEPRALVRLEWGGYFFAPSLSVLAKLRGRAESVAGGTLWDAARGEAEIQQLLQLERRIGEEAARPAWKVALEDPESLLDHRASSIWAAIRQRHGGVLRCAYGVLLADPDGVHGVVKDETRYSAAGYQGRMHDSFGTIFLGFDADDPRYAAESASIVQKIRELPGEATYQRSRELTHERLDRLWQIAREAAEEANDTQWRLQFDVRELLDHLLGGLCEDWFGLRTGPYFERGGQEFTGDPGGPARNPGHFASPSRYFFQPWPNADVKRIGEAHGQALRRAMERQLKDYPEPPPGTAPLLHAVLANPLARQDPGYAARTVIGVIMGFVPTVDGTLRRVLYGWLRETVFQRLRGAGLPLDTLASAGRALGRPLRRAMQVRVAPELLWRTARADHVLGTGEHAVQVRQGDRVVAGLMSATHRRMEQGSDDVYAVFGGDRSQPGAPTHACPGTDAAFAVMLGFLAALLETKIPLRPGPAGLAFEAVGTRPRDPAQVRPMGVPAQQRAAVAFRQPVRMLALGDSWLASGFFVVNSLTRALEEHGWVCDPGYNLASASLTLTGIALKAPQAARLLPDVDLVLVDGGGNDVHQKLPGQPDRAQLDTLLAVVDGRVQLDDAAVRRFVDGLLCEQLQATLSALVALEDGPPVVVVAYDHPVPDGRGPLGLGRPWLAPSFQRAGLDLSDPQQLAHAAGLMAQLIDRLNAMVARVAGQFPAGRVHAVDLTGTLAAPDHRTLWSDELHPNAEGFRRLARELVDAMPLGLPRPLGPAVQPDAATA